MLEGDREGGELTTAANQPAPLVSVIIPVLNGAGTLHEQLQARGIDTILLTGTFNWAEPNALASWLGGDQAVLIPANLSNVTITAPKL